DGGAQVAGVDFATAARSQTARMPPTNDCRPFAGAGPARSDSGRVEIDSRHRTRDWSFEPGVRQRARSGGVENFVATDPEAKRRVAEVARPCRLRREPRERRRQCRTGGAAFAKRNPGNAGASREVGKSA